MSETGGQIEKIEILIIISFVKGTLRTLSNNGERLKNQLIVNLIQKKMLIYQHFFPSKSEYKFLNENLNFIPTSALYNNKAHFKDSDENQMFNTGKKKG